MYLSQEFIPVLSGGAVVWGNLLEVAGGCPASTPISSLTLMKVFGEGAACPPYGDSSESPSPFFLIKIRNDRPERQRAKGAMAEIAPDPGNGLMQVGGGDPGADGRVRLDERGKVVADLEQRPIFGIESVFIAVGVEGVERAEAAHLSRAVTDGLVEL